jgi:hypothetical protein
MQNLKSTIQVTLEQPTPATPRIPYPGNLTSAYILHAKNGDVETALMLLKQIVALLEAGVPLGPDLSDYLKTSLEKTIEIGSQELGATRNDSSQFRDAFHLNPKRGAQPRIDKYDVWRKCEDYIHSGMKKNAAYLATGNIFHCDPDTVKKIYSEYEAINREANEE